jgi:hypothetical protein
VEHYEIAAYGTARAFAEALGESRHASCWKQPWLRKRKRTTNSAELAGEINQQALGGERIPPDRDEVSGKARPADRVTGPTALSGPPPKLKAGRPSLIIYSVPDRRTS